MEGLWGLRGKELISALKSMNEDEWRQFISLLQDHGVQAIVSQKNFTSHKEFVASLTTNDIGS